MCFTYLNPSQQKIRMIENKSLIHLFFVELSNLSRSPKNHNMKKVQAQGLHTASSGSLSAFGLTQQPQNILGTEQTSLAPSWTSCRIAFWWRESHKRHISCSAGGRNASHSEGTNRGSSNIREPKFHKVARSSKDSYSTHKNCKKKTLSQNLMFSL